MCFGAPPRKTPDKVHFSLTYSERNGLAFPSAGGVGLVSAPIYGGAAIAGALGGLGNLGAKLNALFQGGEADLPKTTGETMRLMASPEGDQLAALAASLPLSCSAHAQLEADLVWDAKEKAYVVESGTYVWTGNNNSRFESGKTLLYCQVSGGGTHKLKRNEVRILFPEPNLSKAVSPKSSTRATYTLKVEVQPKEEPVTGEGGWIVAGGNVFEITEKYTTGGTESLITDEYKVAPGGNDFMASGHKAKVQGAPLLFAKSLGYEAEDREIRNGRGNFSETWTAPGGTQAAISWGFNEDQLVAEPKVASTVVRGGTVKLDGSASRGRIRDYAWTFKPTGQSGVLPDASAKKQGATAEVILLDSMEVTLTVSNGDRSDKRSVQVAVTPRESFETTFEQAAEDRQPDSLRPYYQALDPVKAGDPTFEIVLSGGENVCAFDPPAAGEPIHILHPDPEKAPPDEIYTLRQVADRDGPWDGFSYVEGWKAKVKRQTRLNKYILPDGPPSYVGMKNFYEGNLELGYAVEAYLAAVRKHEQLHSDRMERSLQSKDPAKDVEKSIGKDETQLREKIGQQIKEAAQRIHDAAKDPINPEQWHGLLGVPEFRTYKWHPSVFYVGGPNDIGFK
jgi:hypothetical protein